MFIELDYNFGSNNRNNQLFGGRHKRSVQISHEMIHNIVPREIKQLLTISNRINMLETLIHSPAANEQHSRHKRETVDHIATVIQVQYSFNHHVETAL